MAIPFICGAYHFDTSHALLKYDIFNDAFVNASNTFMGQPAIDEGLTAYNRPRVVKRVTSSPANEVIYGARYLVTYPFPGFTSFAWFASVHGGSGPWSNTTRQATIALTDTGIPYLTRGDIFGPTIATGVVAVPNATPFMAEIRIKVHPSDGSIVLVVDNAIALAASGLNTQNLSTTDVGAVEWIPWALWDRYIVYPNGIGRSTFLGKGFHILPGWMAAGVSAQFIPPSGTNVSNIDDTSPDSVSNKSQFINDTDIFSITPIDDTYNHVIAAQANIVANRASVSVPASVASILQVAGVNYQGGSLAADPSPKDKTYVWETSPVDGTDLTVTQLNAAKHGYRRVA